MPEINMEKVVGEKFEDMSIAEMMLVQGSGDVNGEITTSPACVAVSKVVSKVSAAATKSSRPCAQAASGILSFSAASAVSAVKC